MEIFNKSSLNGVSQSSAFSTYSESQFLQERNKKHSQAKQWKSYAWTMFAQCCVKCASRWALKRRFDMTRNCCVPFGNNFECIVKPWRIKNKLVCCQTFLRKILQQHRFKQLSFIFFCRYLNDFWNVIALCEIPIWHSLGRTSKLMGASSLLYICFNISSWT